MSPLSGGGGGGGDTFENYSSAYNLYRSNGPMGDSDFVATINGFTGVAGEVKHNAPSSGDADYLTYVDGLNQLGMLVLHNTTRGNSGYVRNYVKATSMITLDDEVPGDWAINDTITLRSQTCDSGGAPRFFDLYVGDVISADVATVYLYALCRATTANSQLKLHPYETYGVGKIMNLFNGFIDKSFAYTTPLKLTSQTICFAFDVSAVNKGTICMLRLIGWEKPA